MQSNNFTLEKVSLKGFSNFCKNNIPLLVAVTFTLFFTYGLRLFSYTIGGDTVRYMAAGRSLFTDPENQGPALRWINQGRFGLIALQKIWHINEFNPYTVFFCAFCFIWLFTVSWCYILAVFGKKSEGPAHALIPFALFFMTSPVWAEQFYWTLQSAEVAFVVFLCPYVIYLLYAGIFENSRLKLLVSIILVVFMTSVYQATVPLFFCGVLACFILLQRNNPWDMRTYRLVFLKIAACISIALVIYFVLNKISLFIYGGKNELIFTPEKVRDLKDHILRYGYTITIGGISAVQKILNPLIARHAEKGMATVEGISGQARIYGNVILLPAAFLFLIQITADTVKRVGSGKRILYFMAGLGIIVSIFMLPLLANTSIRSQFALALAAAFMPFYLTQRYPKVLARACAVIVLLMALYQAQISAQLFYSDHIRYQEDIRLSVDLDRRITEALDGSEKLPLAFIGCYNLPFRANYLSGQAHGAGVSMFNPPVPGIFESGTSGLFFMHSLGMYYELAAPAQMDRARHIAESMPSYPRPGSVKRLPDMVVIKLSDSTYVP